MDDAALVRGVQRLADLRSDQQCLAARQYTRAQALRQRVALDELHDQEPHRLRALRRCLLEPVDRGDVGMLELGEELRLALQAGEALGVRGELGR